MKKLVIIGGGFAGSSLARQLEGKFEVTLIDSKDYFEFTPGILRTIVEPEHLKKIELPHKRYLRKSKIIVGHVQKIRKDCVVLRGKKIKFDYLAITTGSKYNSPFKEGDVVMTSRAKNLHSQWQNLYKSKKVLIVGGGLVGIELAGEILDKYSDKEITIVHAQDNLIERNHPKSIRHAEKFLKKRGVKILYGERVIGKKNGNYITDKGRKMKMDMAFLCTGIIPNYEFLLENFKENLNEHNQLKVNRHLQVEGQRNLFAAGDITDRSEEKTAQNAQRQANLLAKNIIRLDKGLEMKEYKHKKTPLVISLGKWNGIFEYHNIVITGIIPAFIKWAIEKKEMIKRS